MSEDIAVDVRQHDSAADCQHPVLTTPPAPDGRDDIQHILTEMSTIAFVSSIIATIALPSTINPIERLNIELESFQGYLPIEARQWIYGLMWCASATMALSSVFAAFAITYGAMAANRRGPHELTAVVSVLKGTRFSFIAARGLPAFLRPLFAFHVDSVIYAASLFTVWGATAWQVPILLLVGAVFSLVCGTGFNVYLLLPHYFGFHVGSQAMVVGSLALGFITIVKSSFTDDAIKQHKAVLRAAAVPPASTHPL